MRLNEIQNGAAARVRALPRPVTITCPLPKIISARGVTAPISASQDWPSRRQISAKKAKKLRVA